MLCANLSGANWHPIQAEGHATFFLYFAHFLSPPWNLFLAKKCPIYRPESAKEKRNWRENCPGAKLNFGILQSWLEGRKPSIFPISRLTNENQSEPEKNFQSKSDLNARRECERKRVKLRCNRSSFSKSSSGPRNRLFSSSHLRAWNADFASRFIRGKGTLLPYCDLLSKSLNSDGLLRSRGPRSH